MLRRELVTCNSQVRQLFSIAISFVLFSHPINAGPSCGIALHVQATSYTPLQATSYKLHKLQAARQARSYKLHFTRYTLQTTSYKLHTGQCCGITLVFSTIAVSICRKIRAQRAKARAAPSEAKVPLLARGEASTGSTDAGLISPVGKG